MTRHIANRIEEFLRCRELERPDGRALYAYRCTAEEFSSLAEELSHTDPPYGGGANPAIRAFVLYAAEWWQRRYDGRHWAWEPLLASIDWRLVHYPDLYEPIRDALRWWRVDLVRLTSVRYLGTFACQGGLPLALVGDAHSRVTQYLRAVLKHTAAYRRFVDDPIELARDQQHLLRPPTLRRDHVFRLAADLVEAVLDLEGDAQDEDPLSALDQARPDWRKTMPLDLEDERARELLAGLLREATRGRASPVNDFHVERFLRRTGGGWRLGARVRLPASLSVDHLARQLGIPAVDLPPRLEARMQGDQVRIVGLYASSPESENYLLVSRDAGSATEIWDAEAANEMRLQFLAGNVVDKSVVPYRGGALGELPWAFRGDDDECPFIGEGSVGNRAPEIVVLVPDGCTTEDRVGSASAGSSAGKDEESASRMVEVRALDRRLWRITEPTILETDCGRCVIRPSSQMTEEEYRLSGQRFYDFEAAWPLFRGTKLTLRIVRADGTSRAVPAGEVTWRQTGGDWRQRPDAYGLWEVRHVRGGELRHLGRCGILPDQFGLSIEPGSDMSEGHLVFTGTEAVMVAGHGEEAVVEIREEGDAVRVHAIARDAAPPANVHLRLHWRGPAPLPVQAPFPGQGGRFLRDGRPLDRDCLAVDDLYGVRATALSPESSQKFRVEGELKAPDLESLLRVAHFRRSLRKPGVAHELPLIDVRPMIESLLAASSSSNAQVTLRILDRHGNEHDTAQVSRFAATLEYDPGMAFVSVSPALDDEPAVTFDAFPLARPNTEPVALEVVGPADAPHGAVTSNLDTKEPWLVAVHHADRVRAQPIVIGGRSSQTNDYVGVRDAEPPRLSEAMHDEDLELRTQNIAAAMDAMLEGKDPKRDEEDWAFLTDVLLRADGLPATALDLLGILVTKPNLLVRCMFRLESTPRRLLWRLEDELPFSWLLIRRDIWWTEAKQAFDRLRDLAGVIDGDCDEIARDYVNSILTEGAERISALRTVEADVALRLEGCGVSEEFVAEVHRARDKETPEQIRLRASQDDWPAGDGRNEWQQELEHGELLAKFGLWQFRDEHRARQPIFDTPVAAAGCCFLSKPTPRTTFLVKRIRMHDPEWFDLAYAAAWFKLALIQDKSGK